MRRGFSLIELLIAVSIVGLLAVAVTLGYNNQRLRARETRRIRDVANIASAIESRAFTTGSYVTANTNLLVSDMPALVTEGYMSSIPKDPLPYTSGTTNWCTDYTYRTGLNLPGSFKGITLPSAPAFLVIFGGELVSTAQNIHPLNTNIYAASTKVECNVTRVWSALPSAIP